MNWENVSPFRGKLTASLRELYTINLLQALPHKITLQQSRYLSTTVRLLITEGIRNSMTILQPHQSGEPIPRLPDHSANAKILSRGARFV